MDESLDLNYEEFQHLVKKTLVMIFETYQSVNKQTGFHPYAQAEVQTWFEEELPMQGSNMEDLFHLVKQYVVHTATGNLGPNMYAYVMSGGNQVSTLADFLVSTLNQNTSKWHLAPAMIEIEKRVVAWTAQMFNFPKQAGGVFVSGGSAANLTGITVARNHFLKKNDVNRTGLFGLKPCTLYCSKETHNSIDKSVAELGIGTNHIRKIQCNTDFTINLNALEQQIQVDIASGFTPFCIVGNAGTVNTGAIDDLLSLYKIAKKYDLWFHVDGAYGGLIATLPEFSGLYTGIHLADSIALDFHKWLYQPFEVGCTLVRNWDILKDTFYQAAPYLSQTTEPNNSHNPRLDINEHSFQLSRNAKAFKVWLSIKAYGFERFQNMMRKDILLTRHLEFLINDSTDFTLKSNSDLAIACFRYVDLSLSPEAMAEFNQALIPALEKDGRVFITGTQLNGEFVLRACIINHRKQQKDIAYLLQVIREVATQLKTA
jgi:glutamate/tyrosine decarboxylase-like PLP-dependent enzyme